MKNNRDNDKYIIHILRQKLKILKRNRTRNVRESIISSFVSSVSKHTTEMPADINVTNRLEKMKRSVAISNLTIFIENKAKFEH